MSLLEIFSKDAKLLARNVLPFPFSFILLQCLKNLWGLVQRDGTVGQAHSQPITYGPPYTALCGPKRYLKKKKIGWLGSKSVGTYIESQFSSKYLSQVDSHKCRYKISKNSRKMKMWVFSLKAFMPRVCTHIP